MNCRDFRLVEYQLQIEIDMTANASGFDVIYQGVQTFKTATPREDFSEREIHCLNVGGTPAIPAGKFMFQKLSHCGLNAYSVASNSYANAGQIVITHDSGGGFPDVYPAFATTNLSTQTTTSPDGPYFQAVPFPTVGTAGSGVPPMGSARARNCWINSPANLFSYIYIRNLFDSEFLDASVKFDPFTLGPNNGYDFYSRWGPATGSCIVTITTNLLPPIPA